MCVREYADSKVTALILNQWDMGESMMAVRLLHYCAFWHHRHVHVSTLLQAL